MMAIGEEGDFCLKLPSPATIIYNNGMFCAICIFNSIHNIHTLCTCVLYNCLYHGRIAKALVVLKLNHVLLMLPFTKSVFNYVWVLATSLTCFECH